MGARLKGPAQLAQHQLDRHRQGKDRAVQQKETQDHHHGARNTGLAALCRVKVG